MFYAKNLPAWERGVRFFGAVLMGACAYRFWGGPIGAIFAIAAVVTVATAVVGFCPMCSMAGRRRLMGPKEPA
jgi:hypothetical protein